MERLFQCSKKALAAILFLLGDSGLILGNTVLASTPAKGALVYAKSLLFKPGDFPVKINAIFRHAY
jgi:hypothetical protein